MKSNYIRNVFVISTVVMFLSILYSFSISFSVAKEVNTNLPVNVNCETQKIKHVLDSALHIQLVELRKDLPNRYNKVKN